MSININPIVGAVVGVVLTVIGGLVGYTFSTDVVIDKICKSDKDPVSAFIEGAFKNGNEVVTEAGNKLTVDIELFKQAVQFQCVE